MTDIVQCEPIQANNKYKKLVDKIDKYIKSQSASPMQKSPEWYALKSKTIGGSEVATVLGMNPFKSLKSLVAEKAQISPDSFSGNMATRWGNIFEEVTRQFTMVTLKLACNIVETGSLPGVIEGQRYSPDGLGVVPLLNVDNELEYYIVLFEFKSPFRSIPDGKIPKHYRPQIQTGLLSIPMCELSIFVNNCYRKCSLKEVGFNLSYDFNFHSGDKKKKLTKAQQISKVYATGIVCFYQLSSDLEKLVDTYDVDLNLDINKAFCPVVNAVDPTDKEGMDKEGIDENGIDENGIVNIQEQQFTRAKDDYILLSSTDTVIDFGVEPEPILNRLFELVEKKRVLVKYYPMVLSTENVNTIPFLTDHEIKHTGTNILSNAQANILSNAQANILSNAQANIQDETKSAKKIIKSQLEDFLDMSAEYTPIGFLPWKLVKTDIISDVLLDDWHETIEEPIKTTLDNIKLISESSNPYKTFMQLYEKPAYKATDKPNTESGVEPSNELIDRTNLEMYKSNYDIMEGFDIMTIMDSIS